MRIFAAVVIGLFVADVLSTAWALSVGAQEANPVVHGLLSTGGFEAWIIYKAAWSWAVIGAYALLEPSRFARLSAGVHEALSQRNEKPVSHHNVRVARFVVATGLMTYTAMVCANNVLIAVRLGA